MLKELLAGRTTKEKSAIKAWALAQRPLPEKFSFDNFDITVLSHRVVNMNGKIMYEYILKVEKDGIEFIGETTTTNGSLDNPFYTYNPPFMVPDGTKSTFVDVDGNTKERDNFKEDLDEAIRLMVLRKVKRKILLTKE